MDFHPQAAPISQVVYRKRSFLSTLALGFSALLVTLAIGCASIILYGMNIADRKTENLVELVQQAVRGLPELEKSLPPVLADVLSDRRQPDYRRSISLAARLVAEGGTLHPVLEIKNEGQEVVSLLSMRVVVLDDKGEPVAEWTVWGATPFAADDDWRGPLLPGATRRFAVRGRRQARGGRPLEGRLEALRAEAEITDIRIWKSPEVKIAF